MVSIPRRLFSCCDRLHHSTSQVTWLSYFHLLTQPYHDLGADNDNAPSYSEVVDEVNANIEPFGFQLKRFVDEYSGKAWTAFANTKSDDLAKIATEYTPQEIAYFRTLVGGSISPMLSAHCEKSHSRLYHPSD